MHVLYEESGDFKVGTVLAVTDTSLQVEAPHGKRSKVKSNAVLLRFDTPGAAELLTGAEAMAADVDTDFLWECSGQEEFGFTDLAREYVGHAPTPVEAAGILLKLQSAPMYFYRKGRGRFRAAPADTLKLALAGLEKKRQQQEKIDHWCAELEAHRLPDELRAILPELLYKPDRSKPETRALELACEHAGLAAAKLMEACGALPSTRDYHLGRFLFEHFPKGAGFPEALGQALAMPDDLPLAEVRAFSLDDATTTEIDDAFSLREQGEDEAGKVWRLGIHIAAPGLGFRPGSPLDDAARSRLSTVYFPGDKITMLPPAAIAAYSLAAGAARPALSLYVDFREEDSSILNRHTVIERVPVAANLRHQDTESLDAAFEAAQFPDGGPGDIPFAAELHRLWRFACALEAGRGKQQVGPERTEYNFYVDNDRVDIVPRRRGQPMDKLVAELMILVNSTWGKLLDDNNVAAVYRVQGGGKVRMTTGAAAHQGLGVSHYAWSSSPLRRYVDLVNQWQLLALVSGVSAPFAPNSAELLSAVSDFEATYAAYDEFQRRMENYWCLRWIGQEGVQQLAGHVLRDNLVRLDRLPMVVRVHSLPELAPGMAVELKVSGTDLLEVELKCQFLRALDEGQPA
ncbi:MAG TPA: RNB domain-containing ribonuclease [Burkholderiales bacterium]|nr:RNB domain-containing ribonuclease [Burkholderiales bacterium]